MNYEEIKVILTSSVDIKSLDSKPLLIASVHITFRGYVGSNDLKQRFI